MVIIAESSRRLLLIETVIVNPENTYVQVLFATQANELDVSFGKITVQTVSMISAVDLLEPMLSNLILAFSGIRLP